MNIGNESAREIEIAIREVFGDSDSDVDANQSENSVFQVDMPECGNVWEQVKGINGLWLCRNLLSSQQQNHLLNCINQEGWFNDPSRNQAMRFGDLPMWASKLCEFVGSALCSYDVVCKMCNTSTSCSHLHEKDSPLSPELLWREPLFDQMIVNTYQPGEGICAHVDLLRFEDGIAIISLESQCVMHFTHETSAQELSEIGNKTNPNPESVSESMLQLKIPVLLMPGDIVLMSGEARYNWLHEINRKAGYQIWNGEEIVQSRRTSITFRRLCQPK